MLSIFLGGIRLRRGGYRSRSYRGTGVAFKISNLVASAGIFGTLAYVALFKQSTEYILIWCETNCLDLLLTCTLLMMLVIKVKPIIT